MTIAGVVTALAHSWRGLVLAGAIALCASLLAGHYGAPVMLFALLIGMAFNFLSTQEGFSSGVDFAARECLRVGVALLGFRISFSDIAGQGVVPLVVVACLVAVTISVGFVLAPVFKRSRSLGLLTGAAVAICGASAALAVSAAMPDRDGKDGDTLFTVVAVTTLSTVAMVVYPILFAALGFDDRQSGFLIGATIHDVAQVVGAGYSISEVSGNVATLTKLQRVLLLPLVIIVIIATSRRKGVSGKAGLPWFVPAFIAIVMINSTGILPDVIVTSAVMASKWLLVIAIAALGIKTSLKAMVSLGGNHVYLVVCETLILLGAACVAVAVLF